jgi:hypothetical protein
MLKISIRVQFSFEIGMRKRIIGPAKQEAEFPDRDWLNPEALAEGQSPRRHCSRIEHHSGYPWGDAFASLAQTQLAYKCV